MASSSLPSWLPDVAASRDELLAPIDEAAELAVVLLAGLLAVLAVRWLIARVADSETDGENRTGTASSHADSASGGPAVAFTLPSSLPLSVGVRQVTHNEIHAAELGLAVGVLTGWLSGQNGTAAVAILVAFVSGTLGFRRYCSKAFRTTRSEPWYALIALVIGGALVMFAP